MKLQQPPDVPGQFETTGWFTLAARGDIADPIPAPASGDLSEWSDPDEHFQRTEHFLRSPFSRDILDGAIAAGMLSSHDGEELIPLFEELVDDCHNAEGWKIIEDGTSAGLSDTLFMIEFDLLLALKEIRSPLGLSLALRALSDTEDGFHGVALDVINAIGPRATEAVPTLLKYIESDEPAGLSKDHFDYRRSLRCDACVVLGEINSPEAVSSLWKVIERNLPVDVREAARKAIDDLFDHCHDFRSR